MDIAFIDNLAYNRHSPMHRAGPFPKILMALALLTVLILTSGPILLGGLAIFILLLMVLSCLPLARMLALAGYAAFFGFLFGASGIIPGVTPLIVFLKAVVSSLTMLLLLATTPYTEIFTILSYVMPRALLDPLLMAYKGIFTLLEMTEHFLTAMRLRGGYSSGRIFFNLKNIAPLLGHVLLHSLDVNERIYDIMRIRGYKGGLTWKRPHFSLTAADTLPLAAGLAAIMGLIFMGGAG